MDNYRGRDNHGRKVNPISLDIAAFKYANKLHFRLATNDYYFALNLETFQSATDIMLIR